MTNRKQKTKAADPLEHARGNARGHYESMCELVAALKFYTDGESADRLEELEDEIESLTDEIEDAQDANDDAARDLAVGHLEAWQKDHREELEELRAAKGGFENEDDVRQRIEESALCVEVRSDWHSPGDSDGVKPSEFRIMLSTGGPALCIRGDLDEYGSPTRAYMQMQDWGTPWTDYRTGVDADVVLAFASVFYFGE